MLEAERKYLDANLENVARRLRELSATSTGQHFESNIIFDTRDLELFRSDRLLRLRVQEWPERSRNILTFKYPCARSPELETVKAREELELEIGSCAVMSEIFAQIGYQAQARYEKVRESWRLFANGSAWTVALDISPLGNVVEIEGSPEGMDAIAGTLGLDKSKISLKTYHVLNQEWRAKRGLENKHDLLFEPSVRSRLRLGLGLPDHA